MNGGQLSILLFSANSREKQASEGLYENLQAASPAWNHKLNRL